MAKTGLGRGLNALMPENYQENADAAAELAGGDAGVRQIAVGKIAPSPDQPRKSFDDESIGELAASIRRHGVIQPLIVEALADGLFRIVAGERRWRAAAVAGLKDVPVLVRELGRERRLEVALVENVELAIRYGGSDDGGADFLPETQYGAVVNWGFFENTNLAVEYLHGEFEEDYQETDTITAQLAIQF